MNAVQQLLSSLTKPVARAWHSTGLSHQILTVEFTDGTANAWNLDSGWRFFIDGLTLKDEPCQFLDTTYFTVTQIV